MAKQKIRKLTKKDLKVLRGGRPQAFGDLFSATAASTAKTSPIRPTPKPKPKPVVAPKRRR